jgi:hypothetical protein
MEVPDYLAISFSSTDYVGYMFGASSLESEDNLFFTRGLDRVPAIASLKEQFGLGEKLIEAYFQPYLYLNRDLIRAKGLDQAQVEKAIAAELLKFDGLAYAVSSTALRTDSVPDNLMTHAIPRNFHAKRSGGIYLVFQPNVFINEFDFCCWVWDCWCCR